MTSGDRSRTGSDAAIAPAALLAALVAIAFFALVLPVTLVHGLHAKRLETADSDLQLMVVVLAGSGEELQVPPGVDIVIGPGRRPETGDPVWANGVTYPLGRLAPALQAIGPDPWGNAYMASVDVSARVVSRVFSAGPDGRLDTPAVQSGARTVQTLGDDRALPIR